MFVQFKKMKRNAVKWCAYKILKKWLIAYHNDKQNYFMGRRGSQNILSLEKKKEA